VILRGAGWAELGRNAAMLWVMVVAVFGLAAARFEKLVS
jgi:hypothetical protein